MSAINFSSDLFLGQIELERLQSFLGKDGHEQALRVCTGAAGLLPVRDGEKFTNGAVSVVQSLSGIYTVVVEPVAAVDLDGKYLKTTSQTQLSLPSEGGWHWLICRYTTSSTEPGTWSINASGILTSSVGGLLTNFRGQPNFPTKVRFTNSVYNTGEYEVNTVESDTVAVLGGTSFTVETNLLLEIVGTFTPGVVVAPTSKKPFRFDSTQFTFLREVTLGEPPSLDLGYEFALARLQLVNGQVQLQDKRRDLWQPTYHYHNLISGREKVDSTLGIEAVKWMPKQVASDKALVQLGWVLTSESWSVDLSKRILTCLSVKGGRIKNISQFLDIDFLGWTVYTRLGKVGKIQLVSQQGNSLIFELDTMLPEFFSEDFGVTTVNGACYLVPPVDQVEIRLRPEFSEAPFNLTYKFDAFTSRADLEVPIYKDPTTIYFVEFRVRCGEIFSEWSFIRADFEEGYYTPVNFDITTGVYNNLGDPVKTIYSEPENIAPLVIAMPEHGFWRFRQRVDANIPGIERPSFSPVSALIKLVPGVNTERQQFLGSALYTSLTDGYIILDTTTAIAGHRFQLQLETSVVINPQSKIHIMYGPSVDIDDLTEVKTLEMTDAVEARNLDNGLLFSCYFDGQIWHVNQNYRQPKSFEMTIYAGKDLELDFDQQTGLGQRKGYFGWAICDGQNGTLDLTGAMARGWDGQVVDQKNIKIGDDNATLTLENIPSHDHMLKKLLGKQSQASTKKSIRDMIDYATSYTPDEDKYEELEYLKTGRTGGAPGAELGAAEPFSKLPKHVNVVYVQRLY